VHYPELWSGYSVFRLLKVLDKEINPGLTTLYSSIVHRDLETDTKTFEDTIRAFRIRTRKRTPVVKEGIVSENLDAGQAGEPIDPESSQVNLNKSQLPNSSFY
jgi:hypothetical protein